MSPYTQAEVSRYLSAARQGSLDDVRDMLASGMDVDASDNYGITALMVASQHSRPEMVSYLISQGAQTSERSHGGETALHLSTGYNDVLSHLKVVELLLEAGAPVNARNKQGETPLMAFVQNACGYRDVNIAQGIEPDYIPIIELLIRSGANIYERNDEQETVHHIISREFDNCEPKTRRAIWALLEGGALEKETPTLTRGGHARRI